MKYLIIGSGFAGIWGIEGIRLNDPKGEIILISMEDVYSRPLISYYLGQRVNATALPYRDEQFFKENKVQLKIGSKVKKLDIVQKNVLLDNGEKINFDKLLIATGGIPIFPPIKGNEAKGVFSFTTFKDAQNIEKFIKENHVKSAVVLGGGLIGLKATEALMDLKINVSIVELADRILSTTFDKKASALVETALKSADCQVVTEDTIENIESANGRVISVDLKSKKKIPCQMVIVAIGVRPNLELVKDTPIKINRGIVVNEFLETSVKDVYAAGDVAEAEGWIIAILPVATRHGKIAGFNMAGGQKKYEGGIPKNAIELCGIPTISVGLTDPKDNLDDYEILEKYIPKQNIYRKLVLKENVIVGAIFVNEIDRAGIFTGLIKDKIVVTQFKETLMKDDFGLVSLPKDIRKKHLVTGPGIEI